MQTHSLYSKIILCIAILTSTLCLYSTHFFYVGRRHSGCFYSHLDFQVGQRAYSIPRLQCIFYFIEWIIYKSPYKETVTYSQTQLEELQRKFSDLIFFNKIDNTAFELELISDFFAFLYLLMEQILPNHTFPTLDYFLSDLSVNKVSNILATMDNIMQAIHDKNGIYTKHKNETSALSKNIAGANYYINIEYCVWRYYFIKRLNYVCAGILKQIKNKKFSFLHTLRITETGIVQCKEQTLQLYNELILHTLKKIIDSKSLEPLQTLWSKYQYMVEAGNLKFEKEFFLFLMYTIELIELEVCPKNTFLTDYNNLKNNENIEKVLDILDTKSTNIANSLNIEPIDPTWNFEEQGWLYKVSFFQNKKYLQRNISNSFINCTNKVYSKKANIPVTLLTNFVNRRFYFIERLKRAVATLVNLHEQINQLDFLIHKSNNAFKQKKNTLKPLIQAWSAFCRYKGITDNLFLEELTKEIFTITHYFASYNFEKFSNHIKNNSIAKNEILNMYCNPASKNILNQLDKIALLLESFLSKKPSFSDCKRNNAIKSNIIHESQNIIEPVSSSKIITRFYYIQRLKKGVEILKKCTQKSLSCLQKTKRKKKTVFVLDKNTPHNFSHPIMKKFLTILEKTGNPKSIILFFDDFIHYKYIKSLNLQTDITKLLFGLLKNIIEDCYKKKILNQTKNISSIIEDWNKVDDLSDDYIFEIIEKITYIVEPILEKKNSFWENIWNKILTLLYLKKYPINN